MPTSAAQTVVAERVAHYSAAGDMSTVRYLVRHGIAHISVLAVVGTGLYIATIPLVVEVFDLRVPGPAIALTGVVFFGFLIAVRARRAAGARPARALRAAAGGDQRRAHRVRRRHGPGRAAARAARSAVRRSAWPGSSCSARGCCAASALRRGTGAAGAGLRRRPDVRAVTASAAFIAFAVISNLDLLLAKSSSTATTSASTRRWRRSAKIVTFLPAAIAVAHGAERGARARRAGESRARSCASPPRSCSATAIARRRARRSRRPALVAELMFGPDYAGAADGRAADRAARAPALAMLYLLVVYSVAIRDQRWPLLLLVGVGLQVVGVGAVPRARRPDIAIVQAVAAVVVLLVNEARFHSLLRPRTGGAGMTAGHRLARPARSTTAARSSPRNLREVLARARGHRAARSRSSSSATARPTGPPTAPARSPTSASASCRYELNEGKGHAICHGIEARPRPARSAGSTRTSTSRPRSIVAAARGVRRASRSTRSIGSKRAPRSEVAYPRVRRALLAGASSCSSALLFRVNVRDTQVGAKLFRREMLDTVAPLLLIKRYAFDLEVLAVGAEFGFDRVEEVPIRARLPVHRHAASTGGGAADVPGHARDRLPDPPAPLVRAPVRVAPARARGRAPAATGGPAREQPAARR